ncbi:ELF3-like protein 2 [Canna indica]|uniref:ELF3-like protein 2 n=1 Tax=Canna indica TaxID=4628 RepID=A0AAQ3Q7E5_9LILI|nr:ELF3-like protein 2 [Canna indica]
MKGAKDGDKATGPLFPRLHVNDADKGGPRAPPRNKMALYEQFSIPSQRFNSASSTVPFPPHNSSNLVPSLSSSQGIGHQRNMFPPFYMTPQVPVQSAEMLNSRISDGMNHIALRAEFERKSIKQASSGNLFGSGSLAECSSQQPHNPNGKILSRKILDDADDNVVPTFDQSEILASSKKDAHMTGRGKLNTLNSQQAQKNPAAINSSAQCPNSNEKTLEHTDSAGIKPRISNRNHSGKNLKETSPIEKQKETKEKSVSYKATEVSKSSKDSFAKYDRSNLHLTEKSVNRNTVLCREKDGLSGAQTLNDTAISNDCATMKARSELCSKASPGKRHRTTNLSGNCQKDDSAKENESLEFEEAERKDDASEPSMMDTVSGLVVSPDDIVEVIGPKHFWKARRAIINQQRVFAIQVFELHRLIKVQKLIAASPHILLEGNPYLSKPPAKAPCKTILPRCNTNSQREESRPEDDPQKQNMEQPTEDFAGVPALPPCEDGTKGGQQVQVSKLVSNSGFPTPLPMAPDDKPSPWCFPPLGNQWLVPLMSPSEGFVYKPYSGPCPPTGGFMTPLYGSCTPLGVSHVAGELLNPAYGLPASHRPPNMAVSGSPAMASHYFPAPYGLRPMNPMISSSAVEQGRNLFLVILGSSSYQRTVSFKEVQLAVLLRRRKQKEETHHLLFLQLQQQTALIAHHNPVVEIAKFASSRLCLTMPGLLLSQQQGFSDPFRKKGNSMMCNHISRSEFELFMYNSVEVFCYCLVVLLIFYLINYCACVRWYT